MKNKSRNKSYVVQHQNGQFCFVGLISIVFIFDAVMNFLPIQNPMLQQFIDCFIFRPVLRLYNCLSLPKP